MTPPASSGPERADPNQADPNQADPKQAGLVLVGVDGFVAPAWLEACGVPFTGQTGLAVTCDPAEVTPDRVADMVDDDRAIWDVCAIDAATCQRLGKAGLLRLLDYRVIDRIAPLTGGPASWWGVPGWYFARVPLSNGPALPRPALDWGDLWAVQALPGGRAVAAGSAFGMAEAALLADGVAPESLYPLDVDRACAKWLTLRDDLVVCEDEPAVARAMVSGAAVMAAVETSTAFALHGRDARFVHGWRGAILAARLLAVIQANPAGEAAAMRFIASCQLAERQVALLRLAGLGPADPAGLALAGALAENDPVSPEHRREAVLADIGWYETHGEAWAARWRGLLAPIAEDRAASR